MIQKSVFTYLSLTASLFILCACGSTFEGLKDDFGKITNVVSEKTSEVTTSMTKSKNAKKAEVVMADPLCPAVIIDNQMNSITEFNDPKETNSDLIVSKFNLTDVVTTCALEGDYVSMQIDLTFEGELGPKAKRKSGNKAFFSYPYFIAVNDLEENQLAEEIFAASVTYDKDEQKKKIVETIRQRLPLESKVAPYQIDVGFSLTEEQLFYNASRK